MVMAVADPVEGRRFAKAMQPPFVKMREFILMMVFGGLFLLIVVLLIRENRGFG